MSLKEKIKNTNDIKSEIVTVNVWECDLEVRSISALKRAEILEMVMDENGDMNHNKLHAQMIIASCYDPESGNKVFDENDDEWLLEKSCGAIEMLMTKAMALSGMSKSALDDAEKN